MSYIQKTIEEGIDKAIQTEGTWPARNQVWLANWKKFGFPYCSVYVISPDNHWPCKIGISTNARTRVVALQVACWRPLKVDYSLFCPSIAEARRLEKAMHSELTDDGKLLSGEWFDIRAEEARSLLAFKADVIGVDARDTIPKGDVLDDVHAAMRHYLDTANAIRVYGSSRA